MQTGAASESDVDSRLLARLVRPVGSCGAALRSSPPGCPGNVSIRSVALQPQLCVCTHCGWRGCTCMVLWTHVLLLCNLRVTTHLLLCWTPSCGPRAAHRWQPGGALREPRLAGFISHPFQTVGSEQALDSNKRPSSSIGVLCRCRHPKKRVVPADAFLPAQGQLCVHRSPHWLGGGWWWHHRGACGCAVAPLKARLSWRRVLMYTVGVLMWGLLLDVTCSCLLETESRVSDPRLVLRCGCCCRLDCSGQVWGLQKAKIVAKSSPAPLSPALLVCVWLNDNAPECQGPSMPAHTCAQPGKTCQHSSHNKPTNPVHTPPRTASAQTHRTHKPHAMPRQGTPHKTGGTQPAAGTGAVLPGNTHARPSVAAATAADCRNSHCLLTQAAAWLPLPVQQLLPLPAHYTIATACCCLLLSLLLSQRRATSRSGGW